MICSFCGEDHSWLYCRKKPEGWKPPKKLGRSIPQKQVESDDNSKPAELRSNTPKRRGRPSTGFDKAEYNRQYMRRKRAAEKH